MFQPTFRAAEAIDRAMRIVAGNTANAPTSLAAAVAAGERRVVNTGSLNKRAACATNECVSCPFAGERGSC